SPRKCRSVTCWRTSRPSACLSCSVRSRRSARVRRCGRSTYATPTATSSRSRTRPDEAMKLSIVVPAYNEESTVGGVVRAHVDLGRRLAPGDVEVIVCDDGSTDPTPQRVAHIAAETPEVRLIRNERNTGIPATMKRLYAEARGEWVYFTPADGQVPVGALETMWNAREGMALVVGQRVPRRD